MVTIDKIVIAINNALEEHFPNIKIYNETIKQGIGPPCFFVTVLNVTTEKGLCRTYTEKISFDVQYVSDLEDSSSDFMKVQNSLLRYIEYVQLEDGKVVRLENRRIKKVDNILHCLFDVNIRLIEVIKNTKMNSLEKKGGVKNE